MDKTPAAPNLDLDRETATKPAVDPKVVARGGGSPVEDEPEPQVPSTVNNAALIIFGLLAVAVLFAPLLWGAGALAAWFGPPQTVAPAIWIFWALLAFAAFWMTWRQYRRGA
jgi:hypothetical protein